MRSDLQPFQRELTQRTVAGDWQHEAVRLLHESLEALQVDVAQVPTQVSLRQWFSWLALLRNKTRGHGAPLGLECSAALEALQKSIQIIVGQLGIFKAEWVHLHRNLSGKYRVTALSESSERFPT